MTLWLALSPGEIPPRVQDYHAVVIDILRASSTVCAGLRQGVAAFRPMAGLDEARDFASRNSLPLVGERGGLPPPGFDMGNSPRERWESLKDRTVVYTTTNGTGAMIKVAGARSVMVGAAVNFGMVVARVGRLLAAGESVMLLCAGRSRGEPTDDWYCAGRMAQMLGAHTEPEGASDRCLSLVGRFGQDWYAALADSAAGRSLIGLDLESDLRWSARQDGCPLLPVIRGDLITLSSDSA